jgi:uncharacterized protein YjbI with pentapeptide repeats
LVSFLPYHSVSHSWFHRLILLFDMLFILLLIRASSEVKLAGISVGRFFAFNLSIIVGLVAIIICTIPNEKHEEWILKLVPSDWIYDVEVRHDISLSGFDAGPPSLNSRKILWGTYQLFEAPWTFANLRRNIIAPDSNLVITKPTETQIEKLGERRAWQEYSRSKDLTGRDLRFANLVGSDLRGTNLQGSNLRGAVLDRAKLDFVNASSGGLDLIPRCAGELEAGECLADFSAISGVGISMQDANLRGANFRLANLREAKLQGPQASSAIFDLAGMESAVLTKVDLSFTKLRGASLQNAQIYSSDFSYVHAEAANFSSTYFVSVDFNNKTNLSGSTFVGARFFDVAFSDVELSGADFDGATFDSEHPVVEHDESVSFQYVRIEPLSKDEMDEILKKIEDPDTKKVASEQLKKRTETKAKPALVEGRDANPTTLLSLACKDGRGNVNIAIGLLRRVRWARDSYERDSKLFENSTPSWSSSNSPWAGLENALEDPKQCGEAAEVVRHHDVNW